MIGCTRCGSWHLDVEKSQGKMMSCTEVHCFWTQIKKKHKDLYGHFPGISTNASKDWICITCKRKLFSY